DRVGDLDKLREDVALILNRTFLAIVQNARRTAVPDYAIGHSETARPSILGLLLRGAIGRSATPAVPSMPALPSGDARRPAFRRALSTVGGWALGALHDVWRYGLAPLTRTHPTLIDRVKVLRDPDLQVEQDPTVPLTYAALPIVLFPFLAQQLTGNELVSN